MANLRTKLREAARLALQQHGYQVEVSSVAGVAPGARLTAVKGREAPLDVAVRTSLKREVGLVPREKGGWKTASSVDLINVAVPSKSPNQIEVLCFKKRTLITAFDDHVREYLATAEPDVPIFIPLDDVRSKRSGLTKPGLKKLALWVDEFQVDELDRQSKTEQLEQFIERVTREFADLVGINSRRVIVDFRISSKTPNMNS